MNKYLRRPKKIWGFAGYVYIIQAGPYAKVGVARNVEKRIDELQTGCPEKIVLVRAIPHRNPYRLERKLHYWLKPYQSYGEWFRVESKVVIALVDSF